MTWAPPGKAANSGRWRYDLAKGLVPPGHSTDPQGTQVELPDHFSPGSAPQGFHVVESPPGTSAPIDAINYTPDTKEVSDVGMLAPVDKRNLSLIPSSGLARLAAARRNQRQPLSAAATGGTGMGAGADMASFGGVPPLSQGPFSPDTQSRGSNRPSVGAVPNSGTLPTSAPPGAPYGRLPLGIGAGADANGLNPGDDGYDPSTDTSATDPTAGVSDAPTSTESGPPDPNWKNVGPEYTGHRRIDDQHMAEFQQGKVVGIWTRKPGTNDTDPNAWTFERSPADSSTPKGVTYTQEPQPDGSIKLTGSNGDVRFVKPPTAPGSTATKYNAPYVDQDGNLVQQGSNGEIRVIQRSPAAKTPQVTWGAEQTDANGNTYQTSSTGQVRYVNKQTAATEHWDDAQAKPDGSVWQTNKDTGKIQILQGPTKTYGVPITVGNRVVELQKDPATGQDKYVEVYRAPNNMTLQTQADGTIVGIDPQTGDAKPLMSDPNAAEDERLKQAQSRMQTAASEMNMMPQVSDVGGNLIVPPGAEADVTDWNPLTGQTSQRTMGHQQTLPQVLQTYGIADPTQPAQPTATTPSPQPAQPQAAQPAAPTAAAPASPAAPAPTDVSGYGTPGGYQGAPNPNVFGSAPDSTAMPQPPFAQSDIPEGTSRQAVPPPDDTMPADDTQPDLTDVGSGADKGSQFDQQDIMADIPRFSRRPRWRGLGSKFLGRGLDDFQPFVGVGQDSGGMGQPPAASPSPTPPVGPGAAIPPVSTGGGGGKPQWNPQQLQQLLPLLLMLLSGGGSGAGSAGSLPGASPAASPSPMPPQPPTGGMGGAGSVPPDPTAGAGPMPPGMMGGGADAPKGRWRPPIDPSQVLGTGHKYGEAMAQGEPVHHGVDLQAPKGTPVKAPVDGTAQLRHNSQGLGNEVAIISPDGKEHRLGHLDKVMVKPGEQVRAGQPVGTVGDTGLTTGANLHYDERKGGRHFDPSKKMGVLASMPPVPGTEMMNANQPQDGGGDLGAGAEAQDLGVGAGGMRLANGNWSDALADTPENQAKYGSGSGFQGNVGYGGKGSGGGGGGGDGGGTQVGIDPATRARLGLDTQVAQWNHDQQTAQLQQSAQAENDRHAEAIQQLQQAAQQEADWKSVQEATNAENARHNQAQEEIAQKQQALDLQLETMKEQFQAGQTSQANAVSTMQSALSNPWLQALTKMGITPGGGASGGANPLMNLINAVLGGNTGGSLGASGAFAGAAGAQLPQVSPAQWASMSVPQKAAMRAQVEAMGPGAWEQFQANFQNTAGTNQAPDQTQLQAATASPEDQLGTQMSAEMFGEGAPSFQARQQKNWDASRGSNVMQSLLAGTGWG